MERAQWPRCTPLPPLISLSLLTLTSQSRAPVSGCNICHGCWLACSAAPRVALASAIRRPLHLSRLHDCPFIPLCRLPSPSLQLGISMSRICRWNFDGTTKAQQPQTTLRFFISKCILISVASTYPRPSVSLSSFLHFTLLTMLSCFLQLVTVLYISIGADNILPIINCSPLSACGILIEKKDN